MKKILALALTILLILAAGCTPGAPSSQSTTEVQRPEKSNTGHFVLSRPALEDLEEKISRLTAENIYSRTALKTLKYYGVNVQLENISKSDNDTVYFDLVLSNADKTVTFPAICKLFYQYLENMPGQYIPRVDAAGSSLDVTDSVITLNTGLDMMCLDLFSLEKLPVSFELDALGKKRCVTGCTKRNDGYACTYYTETEKGIAFFDNSGAYRKRYLINPSDFSDSYRREVLIAWQKDNLSNRNAEIIPTFRNDLVFLNEKETVLRCGSSGTYAADEGQIVSSTILADAECSRGRLTVYKVGRTDMNEQKLSYYLVAVRQYQGKTQKLYCDIDVNPGFGFGGDTDGENYWVNSSRDGVINLNCNYTGQKITFDFNRMAAESIYVASDRMILKKDSLTISPDKKYSLFAVCHSGGGDISYSNILLKENSTGQLKYIDYLGGMYGGGSEAGFFSNGDVYVLKMDDFKVFNTDMNSQQPIFCLSDKYPFGDYVDGGTKARWLLAARRDPKDYTYIAVYAEVSRENGKIALDEWRLNGTYKVGFFDAYGRLIKEYDTGVDVLMSAFGLVPVNMWLSGENLHMYGFVKNTDNRYFEGYININTGKYTPVKNFDR